MDLRNLNQEELIKRINMLEEKIKKQDKQINVLSEQLHWYSQQVKLQQKKLFGSSSEKTVLPDQISLFDEIELESTLIKAEPKLEEITYRRKKKNNRRGLDLSSLPTTTKIYDIEDKSCPDCGESLRKIGENVRKELVYHPARYEVIEHVQYVYTCDRCENNSLKSKMYKADMKDSIIFKSFASPSLLSYIIDNKFNKGLPLYRQEVMFNQIGLKLSRQTMANWMIKLYSEYLKKMTDYMHKVLLQSDYLHADETTNQVLNVPNQKPTTKSYMWVYKTGRSEDKQIVHFIYENTRSHEHAKKHLEGYHNILQTDGYQAYGKLEGIKHMGCWAHCRRKYSEALESAPAGSDLKASASYRLLHKINKLFTLEKKLVGKSYEEIKETRQKEAKPIIDDFFNDVKECAKVAVGQTKLSKALTYSINQEENLRFYLEDGRIEISNNRAENSIRPFCVGRRNWLFSNTIKGAKASATLYSLVETAKLNNLKPYDYFEYLLSVLTEIDINDDEKLEEIMPWSKSLPENVYLIKKS
jgi:transposase